MSIPYFHCYILFLLFCSNSFAAAEKWSDKGKFILNGIIPPVYTPMDEWGQVDVSVIPDYAKYLKKHGLTGVLIGGTSGEGPNLSVDERKILFEAWMKACKPLGLLVVAQIGGAPLADIIQLARYAEKLKVDVILTLPTVYYKPKTVEELTMLLEMVAEAAPTRPLMYYHSPDMTDVYLDMPTVFKMASERIPHFIGLKSELPSVLSVLAAIDLRPDQGFGIANYPLTLQSVALGQDVFFSSVANVYPHMVMKLIDCTKAGNMQCARKLQLDMNRLSDRITSFGYEASLKAATEMVSGLTLGNTRPPLPIMTAEELQAIKAALEEYGIEVISYPWI